MKLQLKQYQHIKEEIASKEVDITPEPYYYFETGIRRSVRVFPEFTNWKKEMKNEDEVLHVLHFTCVYDSWRTKIERISISASEVASIYYNDAHEYNDYVKSFIDKTNAPRTKEQFENDLNSVIKKLL